MLGLRFGALAITGLVGVVVAACSFPRGDGVLQPDAPPADLPPVVQFQFKQTSTDEADGGVAVKVVMSRVSTIPASVTYSVTGGSATEGAAGDYTILTGISGTIEFAPGETMKEIAIAIRRDLDADEQDETIDLALQAKDNATIGENSTNKVTIASNFLPRVQFDVATSNAVEETPQTFRISMNTTSPNDVVVEYVVTGTAAATDTTENPRDHLLGATGSVTIPAGMLSVDIDPQIVDDLFDEVDETIDITINPVAFAKAGQVANRVHTITNADPPPTVQFGAAQSMTAESGMAIIPVTLTPQSGKTVTVDFAALAGGSAAGTDFTVVGSTLTFTPGVVTQNIVVMIGVDTTDEIDEIANIGLANPTNATLGATTSHALTILDDDGPPEINFSAIASNPSEGAGTQTITVALSAISGKDVSFSVNLGGTAAVGTGNDYTLATTTFTIPAGMPSVSFDVTILNDTLDEDDETATFALGNPSNCTIGPDDVHTMTIVDDDLPPIVRFNPGGPSQSAPEGDTGTTTFVYQVVLLAKSGKTVTVPVAISGTANAADFSIPNGDLPVVFAPGTQVRSINVIVNGDTNVESDNTVIMTLQTPTNGTLDSVPANLTRTHTILNDDP